LTNAAGLLKELPVNAFASWLYGADLHATPIVGDALLLKQAWDEDGYTWAGLTADEITELLDEFGLTTQ
jgi:hypothetical protein